MTGGELTPWIVFICAVVGLLAFDLGYLGRRGGEMPVRTAFLWSGVWIALGLSFSLAVWAWYGPVAAQEYVAGYLIEESLSIDNLFVFLLVFSSLGIALRHQRKVLFWGIFGAIVLRGLFIFAGVGILNRFEWVMYVFGAVLVLTAFKMVSSKGIDPDPERNPMVRAARRLFPVAADYDGSNFSVRRDGRRLLTPLAIGLVAIESADLVFAIDSVPAVLAITGTAYVAFTSNIAAILGLRALYFALAGTLQRFEHLNWGLAVVLGFVGVKMLLCDVVHIPVSVSLAVIVLAVGGAILFSLHATREKAGGGPAAASGAELAPADDTQAPQ